MKRLALTLVFWAGLQTAAGCAGQAFDHEAQYRKLLSAVVHVEIMESVDKNGNGVLDVLGSGSGWLLSDGRTVVTARHVLLDFKQQPIPLKDFSLHFSDGTKLEAEAYDWSPVQDVGAFRLKPLAKSRPGLKLNPKAPVGGQELGAMGWSLWDSKPSYIGWRVTGQSHNEPDFGLLYEAIGNMTSGNSGGPVVDARGEVRGMMLATRSDEAGYGCLLDPVVLGQELSKFKYEAVK